MLLWADVLRLNMNCYLSLAASEHVHCRAELLVKQILPAWDTPTGIPYNLINLATSKAKNPSWALRGSTLSEFGSEQMEFVKLSESTGNATYANMSEHCIRFLHQKYPEKVSYHMLSGLKTHLQLFIMLIMLASFRAHGTMCMASLRYLMLS